MVVQWVRSCVTVPQDAGWITAAVAVFRTEAKHENDSVWTYWRTLRSPAAKIIPQPSNAARVIVKVYIVDA